MRVQKDIQKKTFGLFSFKSNFKLLFIFNFLISFFIFDLVKADNDNSTLNSNEKLTIDYLNSRSKSENLNLDSETIELILENAKNRTEIDIDYLNPKNELEDYIVDTGDSLLIEFKNKPRGLGLTEWEYDPKNISYLNPRNDLRNYKLDEGDVLDIKFPNIPEFNLVEKIDPEGGVDLSNIREAPREYSIDQEGEIYLPRLKSTYVKGLNIYQLKKLLEEKYKEFLIDPEIEIRISGFRFMGSGIYSINNEGELMLPLLKETYVRGLTTNEISNLLSKKYLNSEYITSEV